MEFWIAALVLAVLVGVLLLLGIVRARPAPAPGAEDMQVYRDQLREMEKDRARGILSEPEAGRLRVEISRRILEADRAASGAAPARPAPRWATWTAAGVVCLAVAGSFALYLWIGAPGHPDMPLAARHAAAQAEHENRIGQAEAEALMHEAGSALAPDGPVAGDAEDAQHRALVERLRRVLVTRPDDLQGHRLLASSEAALGDFAAAWKAQEQVIALSGEEATADDLVALADLMIRAAGGHVSPEAEAALEAALARDPRHQPARFYTGMMTAQSGRPDVTFHIWRELLEEGPENAPWMAAVRSQIADLAAIAGERYQAPPPGTGAAGPTPEQIASAADLPPEERDAMIRGMVEGLSARLASQGGSAQDWSRLIGALGVLGDREQAAAIWAEAQTVFGGRPDDLEVVLEGARAAGVAQ